MIFNHRTTSLKVFGFTLQWFFYYISDLYALFGGFISRWTLCYIKSGRLKCIAMSIIYQQTPSFDKLQRIYFLEVLVICCTPKASFPVLSTAGMSSSTSPRAASQRLGIHSPGSQLLPGHAEPDVGPPFPQLVFTHPFLESV